MHDDELFRNLLYISDASGSDARFYVDSTGLYYRVIHDNGTGVGCNLSTSPSRSDTVELVAELFSDGDVQLGIATNDGDITKATASNTGETFANAWSGTVLNLGGPDPVFSKGGFNPLIAAIIARGSRSLADFRGLLP